MFGMSNDQMMGLLRQVLPIVGGIASALGWISPDKVATLTATVLQIAGPIMIVVGSIWALFANKQTSVAASIGANPNTIVTQNAGGTATVTITDPAMAQAAVQASNTAAAG